MPPWRKGRGLGPFTSARPAAGPLLSSQPPWPQTTQNSRSLGDPGHANEHLWSVARAAAGRRCSPFPLTSGHQPVGHGWPYRALTATAEAVVPVTRRLDRRAYSGRTRRGCAPGGHPCRLGIDASATERCFTRRASRPPGSGVAARFGRRAVARCRRDAAPLRSCGLEPGPEVWRGTWRLLLRHGEQAPAVSGTKSSSCLCGGCQATGPPVLPLHSAFGMRSSARQRLRGLPASVPCGTASTHRHPARVWHPERH
jgi:hypothetical protein